MVGENGSSVEMKKRGSLDLEPVVAHGARMSWAGILRPRDRFPPSVRSELAVITAESGPQPRRYFGKWSGAYSRFTTNLTSGRLVVTPLLPSQAVGEGVLCILHWVDRESLIRSDRGSVCQGDGWPIALWNEFVSRLEALPDGSVTEKLRSFKESRQADEDKLVSEWRARISEGKVISPDERTGSGLGERWLPTPARLHTDDGPTECIVSWAPWARVYPSMSAAITSTEAAALEPDLASQARYYFECTLARLHGVRFGKYDYMLDEAYERTPEAIWVGASLKRLEQQRIARLGRLDRFPKANAGL